MGSTGFGTKSLSEITRGYDVVLAVGTRFHGFSGEPRDWAVYAIFNICIIKLREIWFGVKNNTIIFLTLIIKKMAK